MLLSLDGPFVPLIMSPASSMCLTSMADSCSAKKCRCKIRSCLAASSPLGFYSTPLGPCNSTPFSAKHSVPPLQCSRTCGKRSKDPSTNEVNTCEHVRKAPMKSIWSLHKLPQSYWASQRKMAPQSTTEKSGSWLFLHCFGLEDALRAP